MQRWNRTRFLHRMVSALVLVISVWGVTGAQAQEFETVEVTLIACRIVSDEMVTDDGVLHIRQRVLEAAVVSNDPYFAGEGTVISNADLFPEASRGVLQGVIEIRPDAFDGFWSGSFAMVMDEDGQRGWTVSQGNGPDLQGLYVESVLRQLPPSAVAEYAWACDGEAPVSGSVATGTVARLRPDGEP